MALTYGFYNSINGDRMYDAEDMSSFFDGLIGDGVFKNIGSCFLVKPADPAGNQVIVGTGRAWLKHTWTLNDADILLEMPESEPTLARYDAIVIEVDRSEGVRANRITVVKGTPAVNPTFPQLQKTDTYSQWPLAYVIRRGSTPVITQPDIRIVVGTDETPFVTGIVQTLSVSALLAQWEAQYANWFNAQKDSSNNQFDIWRNSKSAEFDTWFSNLVTNLEGDVAANLQNQLTELSAALNDLAIGKGISRSIEDSSNDTLLDSAGGKIEGLLVRNT